MPAKRFYKHKLLLDEQMPIRRVFPRINERFDVKHIATDLRQAGLPDPQVYELAVEAGRILVTRNSRDFRDLVRKDDPGVISIPPHTPVRVLDTRLSSLLIRHDPAHFRGRVIPLGGEGGEQP